MKKAGLIICLLLLLIGCKSKTVSRDTEDLKIKKVSNAEISSEQQRKASLKLILLRIAISTAKSPS